MWLGAEKLGREVIGALRIPAFGTEKDGALRAVKPGDEKLGAVRTTGAESAGLETAGTLGVIVAGLCLSTGLPAATLDKLREVAGEVPVAGALLRLEGRIPWRTAGSRIVVAEVPPATPDKLREVAGEVAPAVALLRLAGRIPWRTAGSRTVAGGVERTVVEAPAAGLLWNVAVELRGRFELGTAGAGAALEVPGRLMVFP
jgi:hypothetical protein